MYDVTIIGAGVSGIFLAHSLAKSNQRILLIDKGKSLSQRSCPLDKGENCNCDTCDKYFGFAGLGKSEGKFNYTNGFGGELEQKVGKAYFLQLMDEVDKIICKFGGDAVPKYSTENSQLAKKAEANGLQMLTTEVRHLGSTLSIKVFQQIYEYLQTKIDMQFQTDVQEIIHQDDMFTMITDQGIIHSKQVVFATGRAGADWLQDMCSSLGVKQGKTRVELGIRVEMNKQSLQSILQDTFETKLAYQEGKYTATTYCMNPKGRVIRKYQEGLVMPDGQNFREQETGTTNLNFTLFIPHYFPTLAEANSYASTIISKINRGYDRIIVQRLGDLRTGQPTTKEQMSNNRVKPTLHASYGDLSTEIPALYIKILHGFLERLECLIEAPIDEDTLLYGIDGKFHAPIIESDEVLETNVRGLYVIGDCSGVTHSLSQAAASGLYLGNYLSRKHTSLSKSEVSMGSQ